MKRLIAIASSLVLASGIAFAGETADEVSFQNYDKDGNGSISKVEAADHNELVALFNDADMNRDGYLSQAEFEGLKPELEEAE